MERACCQPLESEVMLRDDFLFEVFSVLGIGHWIYVAGVCRRWRGLYFSSCRKLIKQKPDRDSHIEMVTLHRHAVVSSRSIDWACNSGFVWATVNMERLIYKLRCTLDVCLLQALRNSGMPWHDTLCYNAVASNRLDSLIWLHEQGCPWEFWDVWTRAAVTLDEPMMEYIFHVEAPFSHHELEGLLWDSGASRLPEVGVWLRKKGAPWPSKFIDDRGKDFWEVNMIDWSYNEGRPFINWPCEVWANKVNAHDSPDYVKKECRELYEWGKQKGLCKQCIHHIEPANE